MCDPLIQSAVLKLWLSSPSARRSFLPSGRHLFLLDFFLAPLNSKLVRACFLSHLEAFPCQVPWDKQDQQDVCMKVMGNLFKNKCVFVESIHNPLILLIQIIFDPLYVQFLKTEKVQQTFFHVYYNCLYCYRWNREYNFSKSLTIIKIKSLISIKEKQCTGNDCLHDILKETSLHDWRNKRSVVGGCINNAYTYNGLYIDKYNIHILIHYYCPTYNTHVRIYIICL